RAGSCSDEDDGTARGRRAGRPAQGRIESRAGRRRGSANIGRRCRGPQRGPAPARLGERPLRAPRTGAGPGCSVAAALGARRVTCWGRRPEQGPAVAAGGHEMRIGGAREVKNNENRVGLGAAGVHELIARGHDVVVEAGAGVGSRVSDEDYRAAGATVLDSADEVWARAEMIIKVKEPLPEEYGHLRKGLILFTYL